MNAARKQWIASKDAIALNTRAGSAEERAQCELLSTQFGGASVEVLVLLVQQHRRAMGADVCVAPL